jgi:hypothetical protein
VLQQAKSIGRFGGSATGGSSSDARPGSSVRGMDLDFDGAEGYSDDR